MQNYYSRFSCDVTAAMLVYRTIAKKICWEFDSIITHILSDVLPLFCSPTWPPHHVSENQEYDWFRQWATRVGEMERSCPLGIARIVLAINFVVVQANAQNFLLLKIFRDRKKIFCDFSLRMELLRWVSRIHFSTKTGKHKSENTKQHEGVESFIDQASSVMIAGYWPRPLLRFYRKKKNANRELGQ